MTVLFWIVAVLACADTAFADACDLNPCQNGDCYVDSNNAAACLCRWHETGDGCTFNVCGILECQHEAGCKIDETIKEPRCVCRPEYTDLQCETHVCDKLQCENGGTCKVNASGQAECECPPLTSGLRCEIKLEPCKTKGDIILIFDASGSIGAENFPKQFDFAKTLFRYFTIGDNDVLFGGMVFSYNAKILFYLNEHKSYAELDQAISNVEFMGSITNTHTALQYVDSNGMFSTAKGGRDDAKDIVILITDGDATEQSSTKDMAQKLKNKGITIMAIAVGSGITRSKLEEVVSGPKDIIEAKSYDELKGIEKRVSDLVCAT